MTHASISQALCFMKQEDKSEVEARIENAELPEFALTIRSKCTLKLMYDVVFFYFVDDLEGTPQCT